MKQITRPNTPAQRRASSATRQTQQAQARAQTQAQTQQHISPPATARPAFGASWAASLPAWILLPLRLFLGATFVYAGVQKLTDPQYFRASAPGYIGKQITGFAHGSPIGGLLLHVAVPHAQLVGALVAYGEIAIGAGMLVGLLTRVACGAGLLLSLIFYLSASWRVYPYFYGADIVFVFAWITLLLAGPAAGGTPSLDSWVAPALYARLSRTGRERLTPALAVVFGVPLAPGTPHVPAVSAPAEGVRVARTAANRYASRGRYANVPRRDFLRGLAAGGAGMLVLGWIWGALHPAETPPAAPSTGSGAGAGSGTPGAGGAIAQVSQVPANSAATFTIPSSGDPGVLVHLNNGQFVAYDAVCTHAGCTVDYDSSSQMLFCPCHGAAFDPAHAAAVVQGPTNQPLASVPIHVDTASGAITLNS